MIVYHGSTLSIEKPQILLNELGRDFGFAFYTTDIKSQAERWAVRKARIAFCTEKALSDDDTGLYGQSPLYIFSLFIDEYENMA